MLQEINNYYYHKKNKIRVLFKNLFYNKLKLKNNQKKQKILNKTKIKINKLKRYKYKKNMILKNLGKFFIKELYKLKKILNQ